MPKHIPKICKEFTEYTSMHGIGRFGSAQFLIQKILWMLLFCACIAYCLFQTYSLYVQFQSEPTNTLMKQSYGEIEFPKVSFCNLNPMKFSKMLENEKLFQIINETATKNQVELTEFGLYLEKYLKMYQPQAPLGIESDSDSKNLFYREMAQYSTLDEVAQPRNEFIISCEFEGVKCNTSELKPYRDEFYGRCYKFEPQVSTKQASPGPQGGLTLTLNAEKEEYIPFITGSAGVIMDISKKSANPSSRNPSMKITGTLLSPQTETNIALKNVEYKRLPGSKGKCSKSANSSVAECIEYCVGMAAALASGCSHEITYMDAAPACETLLEMSRNEVIRVNMDISYTCGSCKIPCHETVYEQTLSMTNWPIDTYVPTLKKQLKENGINISAEFETSSMMKIHVFFSTLSTTVIEEEKAYTFGNFLGDIGGQLGLWAGISVLSLAEVIELLILMVAGFITRKNKTADNAQPIKE
ncbi:acid-sensing ion channel 1-like [Crassostrea angulata]|uniref:acid-sensing ion channel 1-like n=1 Tax=Magallana angulata TaxID=2784310 RepID=UPI0022B1A33E|nr:acid-sensing ion channel 1-like [Crassostrea angulata]